MTWASTTGRASKAEPLAAHGAKIVDRPADLADRDIVVIMVSADTDLESVISGEGGLLTGRAATATCPRSSSIPPPSPLESSARIRAVVEACGAQFLAAPVSGNPKVVAAGKLTVAASGPRAAFDAAEPLLAQFGRGVTYVGEGEAARLVKIAHNVFLGVVIQSLAEITVLAERGRGLPGGVPRVPQRLGARLDVHPLQDAGPGQPGLPRRPSPTCCCARTCSWGCRRASELDVPMPLAAAADMLVAQAIGAGYTADDFATLVLEQARRSGYRIEPENVPVDDGLAPEEA